MEKRFKDSSVLSQLPVEQRILLGFMLLIFPMIIISMLSYYTIISIEMDIQEKFNIESMEFMIDVSTDNQNDIIIKVLSKINRSKMAIILCSGGAIAISVILGIFFSRSVLSEIKKSTE